MSALAAALVGGQLASVVLGAVAGTLAVGNTSNATLRSVTDTSQAIDASTGINTGLSLNWAHSSFTLGYGARFTAADITRGFEPAFGQGATAGYGWSRKRWSFSLSASGTIGKIVAPAISAPLRPADSATGPPGTTTPRRSGTTNDTSSDTADTPAPPRAGDPTAPPALPSPYTPQVATLYYGAFSVGIGVGHTFSPRWTGGTSASFSASQGIDWASQIYARPSLSVAGGAGASYRLNRTDSLGTSLGAGYAWVLPIQAPSARDNNGKPLVTPGGGDFYSIGVTESFTHAFTKRTSGTLGGGIAYAHSNPKEGEGTHGMTGSGQASLAHTVPLRGGAGLSYSGSIAYGVSFNPIIGELQEGASAGLGMGWSRGRLSWGASAGFAASAPFFEAESTRAVSAAVFGGYAASPLVSFTAGARASDQVLPAQFVPNAVGPQWGVFVGVNLNAPPLRF